MRRILDENRPKRQKSCTGDVQECQEKPPPNVPLAPVPAATQEEPGARVNNLDETFRNLLVTAKGAPVCVDDGQLLRWKSILEEVTACDPVADTVTGSSWPVLPLATPAGILLHFVDPAIQGQIGNSSGRNAAKRKHHLELED